MNFPLAGNEHVREALQAFIGCNRIPHAIMIEGEAGTGKRTLADFIAKAALCSQGSRPCGECRNCRLADIKSHPDIMRIAPEPGKKSIKVDTVRKVRDDASVKPHLSDRKVFIIENADSMNEQAQNALLKILEEPPGGVIFILLVSSRAAVLNTVLSRCTLLSLSPPETQQALQVIKSLGISDSDDRILEALKNTGGNVGRALDIIKNSSDFAALRTAEEFLNFAFKGEEYKMLALLCPFEKDRLFAESFFKELRTLTLNSLKTCDRHTNRARSLFRIYENTQRYIEMLGTNINLPLLYSAAAADCRTAINL